MIKIPVALTKYVLFASLLFWGNWCQNTMQDMENRQEGLATTFYFIRHAEKETANKNDRNPDLTNVGIERSNKWAGIFEFIDLDAIFSTNYKRTRNTAKPIAVSKNLPVERLNYPEIPYDSLLSVYKGKQILFVGHSNTTPEMVNYLLGSDVYAQMDENDYGSLFVVTLIDKKATSTRLNLD
ncbi:phosphoglycerate mutase family protein [Croceivirga thetidis]|uniref:Histidine phosphatase family protein n=1 Tax=Croceivirga thetidis TaxID=2721623 RepID=A0ABX1GRH8_9FLAO|nr:phosphoglycerate mutase family protein [Croceivirga thetidis]NKI32540.1 histidine phosphatase family protein [Croceivirga thetidis]